MKKKHTIWLTLAFLFSGISETYSQSLKVRADSLYNLGIHHFRIDNDELSVKYLRKSAGIYLSIGDSTNWFKANMKLAEGMSYTSARDSVLDHMDKMRPYIRSKRDEMSYWVARGFINYKFYDYQISASQYDSALQLATVLNDSLNIAHINYYQSINYYKLGRYDESLMLSELAKSYFQKKDLGYEYAQQLILKYHLHNWFGEKSKALQSLKDAEKISDDHNLPATSSVVSKFLAYHYLTAAAYDSAIFHFEKAIQKRSEAESNYIDVNLYLALAGLYIDIGGFDKAKTIYNDLIGIRLANKDYWNAASLLNKFGAHFRNYNQPDSARIYFGLSDKYFQLAKSEVSDVALIERGRSALLWGEPQRAQTFAEEVIERNSDKKLSLIRSYAYQLLSQIEYYKGDYDRALSLARKAKDNPRGYLDDKEIHLDMDLNMARALYKNSNDSAIYYAENILKQLIKLEFEVNDEFTRRISGNYQFHLNEVAAWYAELRKDPETAYELTQLVKNQSLAKFFVISKKAKNDLTKLKSDLKVNELTNLFHRFSGDDIKRDTSNINVLKKEFSFEAEQSRLNGRSNIYRATDHILPVHEIQKMIRDETAILDVSFFEYGLIVFLITKNGIKHQTYDAQVKDALMHAFDDQNKRFIQIMKNELEMNELTSVSDFYRTYLIDPFEEELQAIKNLMVIPDGPVSQISLDPLYDNNGRYLLERFNITYLPSVSVIPKLSTYQENKDSKLFAYSASDFSYSEDAPSDIRSKSLLPLPFAGIEISHVSEYFEDTEILKNDIYVEDYIKRTNLSGYDFIHFATHGINNSSSSKFNKLILTNKLLDMSLTNDGHLTSYEVQNLNLDAELVVLSACNMANGTYIRGNGTFSMQKSFLMAGAKSVIASQWEVVDQSTADFMDKFYSTLTNYKSKSWLERKLYNQQNESSFGINYKAQALRDAKLQMIKHPYYSHPMHWASFVYTGI